MPKINPQLFERLKTKLDVRNARLYALIEAKVRETHLPRELAAMALASEKGINISRYASAEDLAQLRNARPSAPSVPAPSLPAPTPTRVARTARRTAPSPARAATKPAPKPGSAESVFVVHGRNAKARTELFKFLRSIGLKPIEWTKAIEMTGKPSPYVGEILEVAFANAGAIVVLLTPDDEAKLKKKYQHDRDPSYEAALTGQARPNVLFEAGMAFGRNDRNTVLVQLGDLRPFSDVAGRHIVHLSNRTESRQELATKLRAAGCAVDTSGTDWHTTGDLTV